MNVACAAMVNVIALMFFHATPVEAMSLYFLALTSFHLGDLVQRG